MNTPAIKSGFFAGKSISLLAQLLRQKKLSSVDLANYTLQEITRLNNQLNAFVFTDAQLLLQQAKHADTLLAKGTDLGLLQGIPVAIKDNIDTADMPTTCGSAHFANRQPLTDAVCVSRLRQAGALIAGKTLTHEFAYGPTGDRSVQGAAANPYDISRMTGGSSAGNAAAIAAGIVPAAIGTDTGGSIRIPSALCGISGFKPGYDRAWMPGIFPVSDTLDHIGIMAATPADVSAFYYAITQQTAPVLTAPVPLRVGWLSTGLPIMAEVEQCVVAKARSLFTQTLQQQDISALLPAMQRAFACIQRAEVYALHQQRMQQSPELFDEEVRQRLADSALIGGWEYVQALAEQKRIQRAINTLFERYDLLCLPTCPITAPLINERQLNINGKTITTRDALLSLTSPWNLCGTPALTLPAGCVAGLPVGLQIIARWQHEHILLALAAQRDGSA